MYFQGNDERGRTEIRRRRADFGGDEEVVLGSEAGDRPFFWPADTSRDGKWLLYISCAEGSGDGEIVRLALDDAAPERETILTAPNVAEARLSPDGRLVAYSTLGDNHWEVYVYDIASRARALVSVGGGRYPVWSPDGAEYVRLARSRRGRTAARKRPRAPPGAGP